MFVGDQRFTEKFLTVFIQEFSELTAKINADRSVFCFGCICRKKTGKQKIGPTDAIVEYDEDDSRKQPHLPKAPKNPFKFPLQKIPFNFQKKKTKFPFKIF
jgi:hypothetical protein